MTVLAEYNKLIKDMESNQVKLNKIQNELLEKQTEFENSFSTSRLRIKPSLNFEKITINNRASENIEMDLYSAQALLDALRGFFKTRVELGLKS